MSPLPTLPPRVRVVEVGPRDGLQNEAVLVPLATKAAFVEALAAAGLPVVEATSFVHPTLIPQLADADELLARLHRRPGIRYPVLVPNPRGLERALAAGAREIAVFTAASDTFNLKNIRMTVADSLAGFAPVVARARAEGMWVRGYVSTAFGCPYEGAVDPARVVEVVGRLFDLEVDEVSVGDTIGVATPRQVEEVVGRLLARFPADRLALHFHDTRGTALANVYAGLLLGIATFDASAGGLGGCPYAPGAAGNLATEDLLYLLAGLGIETGVDIDQVVAASRLIAAALDHTLPGRYYQAASRGPASPA